MKIQTMNLSALKRACTVILLSTSFAMISYLSQQYFKSDEVQAVTVVSGNDASSALTDELNAATADDFTKFDAKWAYSAGDLGATYSTSQTTFKVWSPTATAVKVISYGKNASANAPQVSTVTMVRGQVANATNKSLNTIGVWSVTIPGDQNGLVYQYQLTFGNGTVSDFPAGSSQANAGKTYGTKSTTAVTNTTQDPYSIATVSGGLRSVVEAPSSVTPTGFSVKEGQEATWRQASPTQAIIDEVHVRNFTNSSSSGVSKVNQGKFLGVSQTGTIDPNTGLETGLSYLKQEGFNYLQMMPMYDYASVSDTGSPTVALPNSYNWGYDPLNYNVPEGSYASSVADPATRVIEAKEMIQGIHNEGMGVIMDVVYNHLYDQASSSFERTEPGYYFRKTSVTGCGDDTATDHVMMRQFILDSIKYWTEHYDIDGFRFDIMANIDTTTMNAVRTELNSIDPHLLTYGEGWYMGADIPGGGSNAAAEVNALWTPNIGYFDDAERDGISLNFADNKNSSENTVINALQGSGGGVENFSTPSQAINYIECHDGYSLSDHEYIQMPWDTPIQHQLRDELASTMNILAEGTTFMQTGQEFNMSHYLDLDGSGTLAQVVQNGHYDNDGTAVGNQIELARNPYNGVISENGKTDYEGDAAANINWDNQKTNANSVDFIQSIMTFKKENPALYPNDYSKIYGSIFSNIDAVAGSGVISYTMSDGTNTYLLIFNSNYETTAVRFGEGGSHQSSMDLTGKTIVATSDVKLTSGSTITTPSLTIDGLSATIIKIK